MTNDDIKRARALVSDLQRSSLFQTRLAGDTITALLAERDALAREVAACASALPGPYYMDPPDGGGVSISEQLKRMARDAARYRWLRKQRWFHDDVLSASDVGPLDVANVDHYVDAAMK